MRPLFFLPLLFAACNATSAEVKPEPLRLLIPGQYHGSEAPASLGPGWFALVPATDGWRLVPAQAKIEKIYDPVMDANGETTGSHIAVKNAAIALLRLPVLAVGKVRTPDMQFNGINRPLSTASPIKISFNGAQYELRLHDSQVYLHKGNRATLLSEIVVGGPDSDDGASLLWAGDLDLDGQLDLLIAYGRYNSSGVCLFMSSRAPGGELVRRVACHGGVGC